MHQILYTFLITVLGFALAGLYGFTHGDIEYQHKATTAADVFTAAGQ